MIIRSILLILLTMSIWLVSHSSPIIETGEQKSKTQDSPQNLANDNRVHYYFSFNLSIRINIFPPTGQVDIELVAADSDLLIMEVSQVINDLGMK